MKETISTKIIKWFYGIHGPLDEYRRNELNRIGNNIAILLLTVNLLLSFIASLLMLSTNNSELTLDIVVSVLLLTVFVSLGYILYETKRHHLTEIDVDAKQEGKIKQKFIKRAIGLGIYFAIAMYGLTILIDWLPNKGALIPLLTEPSTISSAIVSGLIYGLLMGTWEIHQIKSDPNDKKVTQNHLHQKYWLILFIIIVITSLLLIHK
ncbi:MULTISPECIES: DUF3278 domain-containing protein [Limosilactobacillus]|uniref:DUF3278 domain-containing protein n=1 Tax=Limosilactobacillus reuteri subsp. rodentium (strain DSM 17509 / CIP 109821 / 100-23) TaxID=349123 RepID=B3XM19_LIMR1|nr:DUF3278 domain-containing protein [Limosilactobacillus reuteri]EDX43195.1 hypothetical protein Lreu23DRAFT_4714 [Limosilactobacillus reuteri subsp. rodentium]MCC4474753.1 DUF3278 domain-containing protein [Limosilactobacillus reuteri]MCH5379208.1 DUF3278 domain-containing protein [Limosilactobacillus reuteri]OCW63009.1 hypothetical protein BBP12_07700 [Limosilactobacillus reuteri]OCW65475.1 hypothetical protein BBP11_05350 [Limosilactobacillus reuteri]